MANAVLANAVLANSVLANAVLVLYGQILSMYLCSPGLYHNRCDQAS